MGADQFLLTWNNHRANFASVFSELRLQGQLVDVTLLCDGGSFPAHRLVLAACSPYFATLFSTLDSSHPLIFLRDVRQAELEALLEFIYRGQVSVANSELGGLIKIAESLRIKGLGDVSQRDPATSPPPATSHYQHHSGRGTHNNQHYNKHGNKRSVSPCSADTSTTFSLTSNGGSSTHRPKKVARRPSSSNGGCNLLNTSDEGSKTVLGASNQAAAAAAAAAAGVYLPDFTALLSAASSYTHGLAAASFPALAAVSAAAAEYTRQNGGGCGLENKPLAEEGLKLRWCLEKGRDPAPQQQQLLTKLKTEHPDATEASFDGDDANSSSDACINSGEENSSHCRGGVSNASNVTTHQQVALAPNTDAATVDVAASCATSSSTSAAATPVKSEDAESSSVACQQLLQQLYQNTGNAAATTDVSSLLSTYQQLLISSTAVAAAAAPPAGASSNDATNAAVTGLGSAALEETGFSGSSSGSGGASGTASLITTGQDGAGSNRDAKCLTCKLCGATIKHTANFRRHMKQHLNPRRFPCPWCSAAFGRKDNLKTHTRKHHPAEVEAQEGGGVTSTAAPEDSAGGGGGGDDQATTSAEQQEVAAQADENGDLTTYSPNEEEEMGEEEEEEGDDKRDDDDDEADEEKRDDEEEVRRDEDSLVIDEDDEEDDDDEGED